MFPETTILGLIEVLLLTDHYLSLFTSVWWQQFAEYESWNKLYHEAVDWVNTVTCWVQRGPRNPSSRRYASSQIN